MISILFWTIALLSPIYYGTTRIVALYKNPPAAQEAKGRFAENGGFLIFYAVLIVGTSGFLEAAIIDYFKQNLHPNLFLIGIKVVAEGLKYLAPFVYAAIGANLCSQALTK